MAELRPSKRYTDYDEHFPSEPQKNITQSIDSPMYRQLLDAIGGGAVGAAQGISDIGANIAQAPSDLYTWMTGKPGYQAPKPNIREYAPQSSMGQAGESIGEFAAPFASPGLAAETMLMKGSPLLARMLMGATTGAAQSENRELGAGLGAMFPAAGKFIRTPKTYNAATKTLNKSQRLANEVNNLNFNPSDALIKDIEHQFGEKTLAPSRRHIGDLLANTLEGSHAPYFKLQSALGDISRELNPEVSGLKSFFMQPQSSAIERLTGREVNNLRQRLIKEMSSHLKSKDLEHIANMESSGRRDFADYEKFKKLRAKLLKGTAGAAIAGTPAYHLLRSFL